MRPYIPIDVNDLPEEFSFDIGDTEYIFGVNYSSYSDSYSIDLYDEEYNPIIINEPLILNKPLWIESNNPKLPDEQIIPMDESGIETEVNSSNLGSSVQLYLDILGEDENGNPIPDDNNEGSDIGE